MVNISQYLYTEWDMIANRSFSKDVSSEFEKVFNNS